MGWFCGMKPMRASRLSQESGTVLADRMQRGGLVNRLALVLYQNRRGTQEEPHAAITAAL